MVIMKNSNTKICNMERKGSSMTPPDAANGGWTSEQRLILEFLRGSGSVVSGQRVYRQVA